MEKRTDRQTAAEISRETLRRTKWREMAETEPKHHKGNEVMCGKENEAQ